MSGRVTVLAEPDEVVALLRTIPGGKLTRPRPGEILAMRFSPDSGLAVFDATPDEGADIPIHDLDERLEFEVYDFIAENSTWDLFLVNDGSALLDWRGARPYGDDGLSLAANARRAA